MEMSLLWRCLNIVDVPVLFRCVYYRGVCIIEVSVL